MEITLRPHQEADVAWLDERGNGILGHGVGAGKTFSAIMAHRKKTDDGRLLVVAPLILLRQWEEEIGKVWPQARVVLIHSDERGRERSHAAREAILRALMPYDVVVVNYDLLIRLHEPLERAARAGAFAGLIVDEAHRVKGYRGQRARRGKQAKALFSFSDFIPFRVGLTGTPILNGAEDAFGVMRVAGKDTFGDSWPAFEAAYFYDVSRDRNYKILRLKPDRAFEFSEKMRAAMRRLTRDDLRAMYKDFMPELRPPIVYTVEMPVDVAGAYEALRVTSIAELSSGATIERRHILGRYMALQMIASGALAQTSRVLEGIDENGAPVVSEVRDVIVIDMSHKLRALDEIIESIGPGEQVVIWAHFRHEIEAITAHLEQNHEGGVSTVYGGNVGAQRDLHLAEFQAGKRRFLVGQPGAAGEGLNLQNAGHAVYFSRSYSLKDWEQSLGRLPRPGSKYAFVQPHVIVSTGTVDEKIASDLQNKKDVATTITRDDWAEALRNPRSSR